MEYKKKEEIIKQFYAKGLPILAFYEPERKRRLRRMVIVESILVAICALSIYNVELIEKFFLQTTSKGWFDAFGYVIAACALAVLIYPYLVASGFTEDLKSDIMPKVMKTFETMRHTTHSNIISEKELLESTLFSRFNKMEADDSFQGRFDGVGFKILETELALQGRKYYSTSFKGVIVSFDSNKKINAKTTITTANDTAIGNRIPIIMIACLFMPAITMFVPLIAGFIKHGASLFSIELWFCLPTLLIPITFFTIFYIFNKKKFTNVYNSNTKQISLEDIKFAKCFKVFSEDEVEARYLITPSFMERFLNLTTSFGSKKAKCAFFNNKVMFAISTRKNLFEFGSLFKPLDNPKNIGFFNEIFSILDMIDYFKLDEKIGL